jgi:hypothetical protein
MMVDFAIQRRAIGMAADEAIREAACCASGRS